NTTHASLIAAPGTFVASTIVLPQILNCSPGSLQAFATQGVGFKFGDGTYYHLVCGDCCHYAVNVFAGGRYAHLDQDLEANFQISGTTIVASKINFDGGGPRVGLDARVVGCKGLMAYATGSASFIVGHFGASFTQFNIFAGNQGFLDFKSDRIVPI